MYPAYNEVRGARGFFKHPLLEGVGSGRLYVAVGKKTRLCITACTSSALLEMA